MVEPIDPGQHGELHGLEGAPRPALMDQLGLLESVDRRCESIVGKRRPGPTFRDGA